MKPVYVRTAGERGRRPLWQALLLFFAPSKRQKIKKPPREDEQPGESNTIPGAYQSNSPRRSSGRHGYPALKLGERAQPHFYGEPTIATCGGYIDTIPRASARGKEKLRVSIRFRARLFAQSCTLLTARWRNFPFGYTVARRCY